MPGGSTAFWHNNVWTFRLRAPGHVWHDITAPTWQALLDAIEQARIELGIVPS